MKTDGTILIDTKIIDGGMEKGFEIIKGEMASVGITASRVGKQIEGAFSKADLSKPVANAALKVQQLEQQLAAVTSERKLAVFDGDDKASQRLEAQRVAIYDRLEAAREKLAIAVSEAARKEAAAEEKASQQSIRAAEKEASEKERILERQFKELSRPLRKFNSRLNRIVSGALVFNLISRGLRSMLSYFGQAAKKNTEFSATFAQLKGAFLTAFQPIYEVILPALISLMRILTAIIQVVGRFFAAITGKSSAQMVENAKALNKEAAAIGGVGDAAKEAKKQLAGFDEINKLESPETGAGGGGGGAGSDAIAPNFDPLEMTSGLERILKLVGSIAAGLLAWKIASPFVGSLKTAAGIGLAVGGAMLFAFNWADAFANGIDWGNLSGMLLGMAAIAGGLALVFGTVGAAIGLLISGVALVVLALKEWNETGQLTNEACTALVIGITAIGAALSLLTGSWIPLVIAAIVAFVVAAKEKGDEIKAIFAKVVQWFKDTFVRDWTQVFGNTLGTVLNNFSQMCADVLDGLETMFGGLIDFIQNVFAGNWEAAFEGLKTAAKGAANGVISVINGMIRTVTDGINALFRILSFNIELPDGGSIGISLPQFTAPQIPYLAKGAVIPPNKEFLAVLGDQTSGRNLEAPESLLRQIVREESGSGNSDRLAQLLETLISVVEGIEVGDETIGRAAARYNRSISRARGI